MELTKLAVVLTSVLAALAAFNVEAPKTNFVPNYYMKFTYWAQENGKTFATPEEKEFRFKIFLENAKKVENHKNSNALYEIAINQFSDLTKEELKTKFMGYRRNTNSNSVPTFLELPQDTPTNVDWRTEGVVTPVKNQGSCGSCWAFSTTGTLEGAYAITNKMLTSFSEQYLVDCSTNGNYGCDGGEMTNALQYVQDNGIPIESDYPYTAKDGKCKTGVKTIDKIKGWAQVPAGSAAQLQAAVITQPLALGVEADTWFNYSGGVFSDPTCGGNLDHGVLLVGYGVDSKTNQQYWLVKNSWGTSWGEKGYIRILRNDAAGQQICGITIEAEYPFL